MAQPVKCRECKYHKDIPYDCHISCTYGNKDDPVRDILARIQGSTKMKLSFCISDADVHEPDRLLLDRELFPGIAMKKHGIQNGWCLFPANYDPIWLESVLNIKGGCTHYEAIES